MYCVWQAYISPPGLVYPFKPLEEYHGLDLAEATQVKNRLEAGQITGLVNYQGQSSVTHYQGPRPSKGYEIVNCKDCDCNA